MQTFKKQESTARTVPIRVTFSVTWVHSVVLAQAAAKDHVWVHGPIIVKVYVDARGTW